MKDNKLEKELNKLESDLIGAYKSYTKRLTSAPLLPFPIIDYDSLIVDGSQVSTAPSINLDPELVSKLTIGSSQLNYGLADNCSVDNSNHNEPTIQEVQVNKKSKLNDLVKSTLRNLNNQNGTSDLANLPNTWKEFRDTHPIRVENCYINDVSNIMYCSHEHRGQKRTPMDDNVLPNIDYAKGLLALIKLIQLRDCYNRGWVPDWSSDDTKYCIDIGCYGTIHYSEYTNSRKLLSFRSIELGVKFLNNFKDLIEVAKMYL